MITLICGAKGSGKTKKIIDLANAEAENAEGSIVFVTDTKRYSFELRYSIRIINTEANDIHNTDCLIGFLKGILASDHDIQSMYIDGAHRILKMDICEMNDFFDRLDGIVAGSNVKFFITISKDESELPDFVKKYM